MELRQVMRQSVTTVDVHAPLSWAAREMRLHGVGVLPVRKWGHVVGVLTEHDVVAHGLAGADASDTSVGQVMSTSLAWCADDAPLWEAARAMSHSGAKQLLVVDLAGAPVGVLTADDLARLPPDELRPPLDADQLDTLDTGELPSTD